MTAQAAIFDLDGVIVDTAKYHYLAWKRLAAELGFDFSPADNERLKGVSRMQSLEIVLSIGGITASEAQKTEWAEQKNHWYVEYINQLTPEAVLPGVAPFITDLRQRGFRIALASASQNALPILKNLELLSLFDAVVDGTQAVRAKPDPEIFLTAARKLGISPSKCIVFEDAVAGVAAAKRAGMRVVGIGSRAVLKGADLVVSGFTELDGSLLPLGPDEFLLEEVEWRPDQIEFNGSKFFLGNGYMGYRGTMEEFGREQLVACTLAGVYDKVGSAWREPVNAPNGFHTVLFCDGEPLDITCQKPQEHRQILDLRHGLHRRDTLFRCGRNEVRIEAERFLSLDNLHLQVLRYRFRPSKDCTIVLQTGIDGEVWDINGPHFQSLVCGERDNQLLVTGRTGEGKTVVVAELLEPPAGSGVVVTGDLAVYHRIELAAAAGQEYSFTKYISVFTNHDEVPDPKAAALANNRTALETGFDTLWLKHAGLWEERWLRSDVVIDGDAAAQLGLRYSIYLLLAAAPEHTASVSIPGRGLSGQTYKGAIFWDTEMFMLPFFNFTNPRIARHLVQYRCRTLEGARRKAAQYGYRGAFYAWESQESGDDACTDFAVTDVFTGRPIRTYFRDKQIHISADVAYGIWRYYQISGDESVLFEGGAEVILECARFFRSYAYFKPDKDRYEILDVTGPDEYHERVGNNAFTNFMVRETLGIALELLEWLERKNPAFYHGLIEKLRFQDEIESLREFRDKLYIPAADPETLIIEQFDGYRRLEDVTLAELKARIQNPHEYLGGGNGLATTTQIIKQADLVAALTLFKDRFTREVKQANWEFYELRTEHGSSLSYCMYAMLAADIGKSDLAYPFFMKTATIDLNGDYKRYVGTLYIGGTHPAANGGAWMDAVCGFGGLGFDGARAIIRPALPSAWRSLHYTVRIRNQVFHIDIRHGLVRMAADPGNTAAVDFQIGTEIINCLPGREYTVNLPE